MEKWSQSVFEPSVGLGKKSCIRGKTQSPLHRVFGCSVEIVDPVEIRAALVGGCRSHKANNQNRSVYSHFCVVSND